MLAILPHSHASAKYFKIFFFFFNKLRTKKVAVLSKRTADCTVFFLEKNSAGRSQKLHFPFHHSSPPPQLHPSPCVLTIWKPLAWVSGGCDCGSRAPTAAMSSPPTPSLPWKHTHLILSPLALPPPPPYPPTLPPSPSPWKPVAGVGRWGV